MSEFEDNKLETNLASAITNVCAASLLRSGIAGIVKSLYNVDTAEWVTYSLFQRGLKDRLIAIGSGDQRCDDHANFEQKMHTFAMEIESIVDELLKHKLAMPIIQQQSQCIAVVSLTYDSFVLAYKPKYEPDAVRTALHFLTGGNRKDELFRTINKHPAGVAMLDYAKKFLERGVEDEIAINELMSAMSTLGPYDIETNESLVAVCDLDKASELTKTMLQSMWELQAALNKLSVTAFTEHDANIHKLVHNISIGVVHLDVVVAQVSASQLAPEYANLEDLADIFETATTAKIIRCQKIGKQVGTSIKQFQTDAAEQTNVALVKLLASTYGVAAMDPTTTAADNDEPEIPSFTSQNYIKSVSAYSRAWSTSLDGLEAATELAQRPQGDVQQMMNEYDSWLLSGQKGAKPKFQLTLDYTQAAKELAGKTFNFPLNDHKDFVYTLGGQTITDLETTMTAIIQWPFASTFGKDVHKLYHMDIIAQCFVELHANTHLTNMAFFTLSALELRKPPSEALTVLLKQDFKQAKIRMVFLADDKKTKKQTVELKEHDKLIHRAWVLWLRTLLGQDPEAMVDMGKFQTANCDPPRAANAGKVVEFYSGIEDVILYLYTADEMSAKMLAANVSEVLQPWYADAIQRLKAAIGVAIQLGRDSTLDGEDVNSMRLIHDVGFCNNWLSGAGYVVGGFVCQYLNRLGENLDAQGKPLEEIIPEDLKKHINAEHFDRIWCVQNLLKAGLREALQKHIKHLGTVIITTKSCFNSLEKLPPMNQFVKLDTAMQAARQRSRLGRECISIISAVGVLIQESASPNLQNLASATLVQMRALKVRLPRSIRKAICVAAHEELDDSPVEETLEVVLGQIMAEEAVELPSGSSSKARPAELASDGATAASLGAKPLPKHAAPCLRRSVSLRLGPKRQSHLIKHQQGRLEQ
jgi:hypothetical protein